MSNATSTDYIADFILFCSQQFSFQELVSLKNIAVLIFFIFVFPRFLKIVLGFITSKVSKLSSLFFVSLRNYLDFLQINFKGSLKKILPEIFSKTLKICL